jgi:rhamnulokinase
MSYGGRNGYRPSARYAALDLGAESGRAVLGRVGGGRVEIEEVHRFPNRPLRLPTGLHWNVLGLYADSLEGLRRCVASCDGDLAGVGVDAWAVDFALLDREGSLLGVPFHYRDRRTAGMVDRLRRRIPAQQLYETTGIQFMPINTLCQLLAMEGSRAIEAAETLLTIPDLFAYWLCGRAAGERTVASTTQMLGLDGGWAEDVLERLELPRRILPPLVDAGTVLGPMRSEVAEEIGAVREIPVIAVGAHDTASAVVAVPAAAGEEVAFISSGTWSLVGYELDAPVTGEPARSLNVSNEAGVGGTVRLLQNVMGLWLLQECRRTWSREGRAQDYEELMQAAAQCPPGPLIDPDDPALLAPGDMPARIAAACLAGGQEQPREIAQVTRCVLDSLACKYRLALEQVELVCGRRAGVVHVVGGGARNALLCRLTANVLDRPVHAGPVEATAIGNVMVQAMAQQRVGSLEEIRAIVADSVAVDVYLPAEPRRDFERLYERFQGLLRNSGEAAHPDRDLTANGLGAEEAVNEQ